MKTVNCLPEIVRRTNKESNNLFAELILRTIGKERGSCGSGSRSRERMPRAEMTRPAPRLSERGLRVRNCDAVRRDS